MISKIEETSLGGFQLYLATDRVNNNHYFLNMMVGYG